MNIFWLIKRENEKAKVFGLTKEGKYKNKYVPIFELEYRYKLLLQTVKAKS